MIKLILNNRIPKGTIDNLKSTLVKFSEKCSDCNGSGHGFSDRACSSCNGKGTI